MKNIQAAGYNGARMVVRPIHYIEAFITIPDHIVQCL